MKHCGIYEIINRTNGKKYICQSVDIQRRWWEHKARMHDINNNCYDKPLYRAMRRDGIQQFELIILEECSPNELNKKEAEYIQLENTIIPNGYNILADSDKTISSITYCKQCGAIISNYTQHQLCRTCYSASTRIVQRPQKDELVTLLRANNFTKVGKIFGVSDNTIRKWCRAYGLSDKAKDYK